MLVGEDLDFHVARPLDVLLDVDRVVAERLERLVARAAERLRHLGVGAHDAHALAAATGRGLEEHRIAELRRDRTRLRLVAERLGGARHHRDAGGDGELSRRGLAPHRGDRFGRGPDPDQSGIAHGAGEPLALGEKAVPRMNCLCSRAPGGRDQLVAHEVALARRRGADVDRFIRFAHVRRERIGVGVYGDRRDAKLLAGANDAEGDLAAVGDQDLREHSGGSNVRQGEERTTETRSDARARREWCAGQEPTTKATS